MSSTEVSKIEELANKEYKYGFVTDIEADTLPKGLNEDIIRQLSAKKNEPEFMLEWRLKAYRALVNDEGTSLGKCSILSRQLSEFILLLSSKKEANVKKFR